MYEDWTRPVIDYINYVCCKIEIEAVAARVDKISGAYAVFDGKNFLLSLSDGSVGIYNKDLRLHTFSKDYIENAYALMFLNMFSKTLVFEIGL